MIRVLVNSPAVNVKKGISAKTGKPYEIHTQACWLYLVDQDGVEEPFPTKARADLRDGRTAYAPGDYRVHPASVTVGSFEQPGISLILVPAAAGGVDLAND